MPVVSYTIDKWVARQDYEIADKVLLDVTLPPAAVAVQ
jgi:hypothetical protein